MRKRKRAQESGIVVILIRILECKLFLGGLRWQDIKVCNTSEFAVALTASGNVDMADQSTMGCASIIDSQNHKRWSLSWKKPRKILVFSSEGAQRSRDRSQIDRFLRSGRFSARFFYFMQYYPWDTGKRTVFANQAIWDWFDWKKSRIWISKIISENHQATSKPEADFSNERPANEADFSIGVTHTQPQGKCLTLNVFVLKPAGRGTPGFIGPLSLGYIKG